MVNIREHWSSNWIEFLLDQLTACKHDNRMHQMSLYTFLFFISTFYPVAVGSQIGIPSMAEAGNRRAQGNVNREANTSWPLRSTPVF